MKNKKLKKGKSVQELAVSMKNMQGYDIKTGKFIHKKVKVGKHKHYKSEKQLLIDKLNKRYKALQKELEDTRVLKRIKKDLKDIEGLEFTEKGNISMKTKDKLALDLAEEKLKTITQFYKDAANIYKEDNPEKVINYKENQEELKQYIEDKMLEEDYVNDIYEAALEKFYNVKPSDLDANGAKMAAYNDLYDKIKNHAGYDYDTRLKYLHNFIDNIDKFENEMTTTDFLSKFIFNSL